MNRQSRHSRTEITRRRFLRQSAALGVSIGIGSILPSYALGLDGRSAPSGRITLGFIGAGGRAGLLAEGFLNRPDTQVIAVCDPFTDRREALKKTIEEHYALRTPSGLYKGCSSYNDYRELLGRKDIDAVVIATPDHWHALHAIDAIKAGKDVYVEKPLSYSVKEGRAICEAVRRYGRVLLVGQQQRSEKIFRQACELVRNGRIGKLRTIKVGAPAGVASDNFPTVAVPPGLDYDLWLGPAPWAPYNEKRCINLYWFHIADYSAGFITSWGIHHVDIAQWGNGTDRSGPVEIEGKGEFPKDGLLDALRTWRVTCRYANGTELLYSDNDNPCTQGTRFEGTEGWIHVDRDSMDASPKSLLKSVIQPGEIHLYESDNHAGNFLDCIRSRQEPIVPAEIGHRSSTICLLSEIAVRTGRKIQWDPAKEEIIGDPQASALLTRAYREPWRLD